jgi:hypothetical protein
MEPGYFIRNQETNIPPYLG